MSTGGTGGILTALALVGAAGRLGDIDEAEQAEMFAMDAAAPSMVPGRAVARSGDKGGRPVGARNKSTEAWRALFLTKFRHPMMVLGELTARSPEQLARDLGLYMYHEGKPVLIPVVDAEGNPVLQDGEPLREHAPATGEAAKLQKDAAIALLPYLGQKLPMAVEVTPPKRGIVLIGDLPEARQVQGHDLDLPLPPEENQQLSSPLTAQSDGVRSDDARKFLEAHKDFDNGV